MLEPQEASGDDVEGLEGWTASRSLQWISRRTAAVSEARLQNLVPDTVNDEDASFAVLGSYFSSRQCGTQCQRLGKPSLLSDWVCLGHLAAQPLRASGCRVLVHDERHEAIGILPLHSGFEKTIGSQFEQSS